MALKPALLMSVWAARNAAYIAGIDSSLVLPLLKFTEFTISKQLLFGKYYIAISNKITERSKRIIRIIYLRRSSLKQSNFSELPVSSTIPSAIP